jgi:hypothetical protein
MRAHVARSGSRLTVLVATLLAGATACAKPDSARESATPNGATAAAASAAPVREDGVVVNGQRLSAETIQLLQQVYPVAIPAGRYWYDPVSGAYGKDGEPIAGMMVPGLALGGPLNANASHGTSGVFINGRQITAGEKGYLERVCQTPVAPARYWIAANGIGGFEGGAAAFNLGQCPGLAQRSNGPRSMSRTFCDANGACTSTGILGSILTTPE